jgi:hypothetical protein
MSKRINKENNNNNYYYYLELERTQPNLAALCINRFLPSAHYCHAYALGQLKLHT